MTSRQPRAGMTTFRMPSPMEHRLDAGITDSPVNPSVRSLSRAIVPIRLRESDEPKLQRNALTTRSPQGMRRRSPPARPLRRVERGTVFSGRTRRSSHLNSLSEAALSSFDG
jgi:hypothetical protein